MRTDLYKTFLLKMVLTCCIVFVFFTPAHAASYKSGHYPHESSEYGKYSYLNKQETELVYPYEISDRYIAERRKEAEISGVLPVISMENRYLQNTINDLITNGYETIVGQIDGRQANITFSYHIVVYEEYHSILLKCDVVTGSSSSYVTTINFNMATESIIKINDVLGINGVKIANRAIKEEIRNNIDDYNSTYTSIGDNHDFFVDNGDLFIVFDKYEIAPGYRGVIYIPIQIDKIIDFTVEDYKIKTDYSIKMIMLKKITDAFDLTLKWTPKENVVEVFSSDDKLLVQFEIGKNSYKKGRNTDIMLETSSEIDSDRTYVPISFFEELLDLPYSIDVNGNIVFSQYSK